MIKGKGKKSWILVLIISHRNFFIHKMNTDQWDYECIQCYKLQECENLLIILVVGVGTWQTQIWSIRNGFKADKALELHCQRPRQHKYKENLGCGVNHTCMNSDPTLSLIMKYNYVNLRNLCTFSELLSDSWKEDNIYFIYSCCENYMK